MDAVPAAPGAQPPDLAAVNGTDQAPGRDTHPAGREEGQHRERAERNGHGSPAAKEGRPGQDGKQPEPGEARPRRSGRGLLMGTVVCVALFAVAAGIVITGSLNGGGGQPGLVTAYPSARLADGQFAGPGGPIAPQVLPSLTGIAAAGATVVAVGSQATLPDARPLILISPDGGHTWQPAVLRAPDGASMAGAVPMMIAGGPGGWLAEAPDAVWTSPDGRAWQLGPGIAPLASGDRVTGLAQTPGGFVAVGENLRP